MAQPFEGERDGRTPSIDTAHFHCGKRSLALSPPLSKTFVDLGANGISSKTSGCFWKNIEVDQRLEVHKTITYLHQIRTSLKNSLVWTASERFQQVITFHDVIINTKRKSLTTNDSFETGAVTLVSMRWFCRQHGHPTKSWRQRISQSQRL